MESTIQPYTHVAIRLPSETTKVQQIIPNTTISLGKYGSFPANQVLDRPYYLTFEILDEPSESNADSDKHVLRIVSAAELHTESLMLDGGGAPDEVDDVAGAIAGEGGENPSTPSATITPVPANPEERNNRETLDNPSTQSMTVEEIEKLKSGMSQAGQAIINQLMESHSAIDKKTAFSLAKYKLRKRKKYLRRFSIEPLDVVNLTQWMLHQKDPARIMELNDEMLGLIGCWANVHNGGDAFGGGPLDLGATGRWLVVDDTGGLVVAAMAERMGILYPETREQQPTSDEATTTTSGQPSTTPKRTFVQG
ncbi:sphingolipid homeostasis protein orm1, partial [Ascosphaera pollenicola]